MKELALLVMSVTLAGAVAMVVISTPVAFSSQKERRFPQLTMEQLNDQQRLVADEIMKVSSVGISGPYNPMLRSRSWPIACSSCWITCGSTPVCREN